MTRTRNDVALEAAGLLLGNLAVKLPAAIATLKRELDIIDGYPTTTLGDGMSRSTADLTSVERAADARWRMSGNLDDLRDMATTIVELVNTMATMTDRALGTRAPAAEVARCRDAQAGRDGALDWGDATCEELPVKAGVCSACYQRERRWRIGAGLAERDTAPAA
jgi:hypothetical protein